MFLIITVLLKFKGFICAIGNIYGPHTVAERMVFFGELGEILSNWTGCYFLGGDFNATLNMEDRSGGGGGMEPSFSNFVNEKNLIDLPLQNSEFTWFSARHEGIWSRIDRWLLSEEA